VIVRRCVRDSTTSGTMSRMNFLHQSRALAYSVARPAPRCRRKQQNNGMRTITYKAREAEITENLRRESVAFLALQTDELQAPGEEQRSMLLESSTAALQSG
jgi:hypothetical protein